MHLSRPPAQSAVPARGCAGARHPAPLHRPRLLLILNPGSRAGRARRRWPLWLAQLRAAGCHIETRETTCPGDAADFARAARDADAVVACGGDGTINQVLQGLMLQPLPERPALGVLYAGTSPDFCRWHGIPTDPAGAVEALLQQAAHPIDVGRIMLRDAQDVEQTRHFGCSANIGIGAQVAARANRWRPHVGDALGTCAAVVAALNARFPTLQITFDDAPPAQVLPRCCNLTVAKNPFIASGLRLGATVAPDDGQFAVMGLHDHGPWGLLRLLPAMYRGEVNGRRGVLSRTAQSLDIRADAPCAVEFDGDPQGWLPARIEVVRRAVRLLGTVIPCTAADNGVKTPPWTRTAS